MELRSALAWTISAIAAFAACSSIEPPREVCPDDFATCGGECVDTAYHPLHCGACNNACSAGLACVDGACGCPLGLSECGGSCVDTTGDEANCGGCGLACTSGESCVDGACACDDDSTICDDQCVDLARDALHCGECGRACSAGESCSSGRCEVACGGGTLQCGDKCVDPAVDPANCGGCGVACASGESCVDGMCCAPGSVSCDGTCVDIASDPSHCGGCGMACESGEACANGTCCPAGWSACGGTCVDVASDVNHCGECHNACQGVAVCEQGSCVMPVFESCKATLAAGASVGDGLYYVDPNLGDPSDKYQVYCDMTNHGGGWTRCLEFINTADQDVNDNNWFDKCVDDSNASWSGSEVMVKLVGGDQQVLYNEAGNRGGVTWTYDHITSTAALGSQYHSDNHNRLVTLTNGDKLMITGRYSDNSGCGGSIGNGYGIIVYPPSPNYHYNPKMYVMGYLRWHDNAPRNFAVWSTSHEITYNAANFGSCTGENMNAVLGTFEFYVR